MEQKHLVLGEKAAAAILAVEGLHLSPAYRRRIGALHDRGFTADQIREALISELQARQAA